MKANILFIVLFFVVFSGDVTSLDCRSGNVILVTGGDGRTDTQECIDAGYAGCHFHCCGMDPLCMGIDPSICATSCSNDFGTNACCSTPTSIVNETLCNIVVTLWGVSAGVASFVIVLAGIKWMGSMEEPEMRRQAKTNIVHAIVGLIIVMIAMEIANWLFIGAGSFSIYQFSCSP